MPMPNGPVPNSDGQPPPPGAKSGRPGFLPSGRPGGEVAISRTEAQALLALETDEHTGHARAMRDTGMTYAQIDALKARAEAVRGKGFTLKGPGATFAAKNFDDPDAMALGLVSDKDKGAQRGPGGKFLKAGEQPSVPGNPDKQAGARSARDMAVSDVADSKKKVEKKVQKKTREAQIFWTALHECDGDAMCGACRDPVHERWSDAARAASASARKHKASGGDWRVAARSAYGRANTLRKRTTQDPDIERFDAAEHKRAKKAAGGKEFTPQYFDSIRKQTVRKAKRYDVVPLTKGRHELARAPKGGFKKPMRPGRVSAPGGGGYI
jgi:hypothetical protein